MKIHPKQPIVDKAEFEQEYLIHFEDGTHKVELRGINYRLGKYYFWTLDRSIEQFIYISGWKQAQIDGKIFVL